MLVLPERTASGCGDVAVGKGLPGWAVQQKPLHRPSSVGWARAHRLLCADTGQELPRALTASLRARGGGGGSALASLQRGAGDCGLWDKVLGTAPSSICDGSFYVSAWLGHGAQVCRSLTERLKLGCARGFCPGRDLRVTPPL